MGLITIDNMEDGQEANANLWNERFGLIADEINGNINAANLASNAVTTAKIANDAVTSDKLDITRSVDANGWLVTDYGSHKTYTYSQTVTAKTIASNEVTIINATLSPPASRTRENLIFALGYYGTFSGTAVVGIGDGASDKITVQMGNSYHGGLTYTGKIHITATEAA